MRATPRLESLRLSLLGSTAFDFSHIQGCTNTPAYRVVLIHLHTGHCAGQKGAYCFGGPVDVNIRAS